MNITYLVKGLITGLIIGAPIGPIGMLCIRNCIKKGRLHGLYSGLGAAVSDAVYACIIGFGLTFVSNIIAQYHVLLQAVSGIFVCIIGYIIYNSELRSDRVCAKDTSLYEAFVQTFLFSLTNPVIIFSIIGIFTALGVGSIRTDYFSAVLLVFGVFIGSVSWWLILGTRISLGKVKVDLGAPQVQVIKKALGIIIIVCGLFLIVGHVPKLFKFIQGQ